MFINAMFLAYEEARSMMKIVVASNFRQTILGTSSSLLKLQVWVPYFSEAPLPYAVPRYADKQSDDKRGVTLHGAPWSGALNTFTDGISS